MPAHHLGDGGERNMRSGFVVAAVMAVSAATRLVGRSATVLSKDDRRHLSAIEAWIAADDPAFAEALAAGKPRAPRRDRRWPFQLVIVLGVAVGVGSLFFGQPFVLIGGGVVACAGAVADRYRACRRHGPRFGALTLRRYTLRRARPQPPQPPGAHRLRRFHRPKKPTV